MSKLIRLEHTSLVEYGSGKTEVITEYTYVNSEHIITYHQPSRNLTITSTDDRPNRLSLTEGGESKLFEEMGISNA